MGRVIAAVLFVVGLLWVASRAEGGDGEPIAVAAVMVVGLLGILGGGRR